MIKHPIAFENDIFVACTTGTEGGFGYYGRIENLTKTQYESYISRLTSSAEISIEPVFSIIIGF